MKFLLMFLGSLLTLAVQASCSEIRFRFVTREQVEVMPMELTIGWYYDDRCHISANRSSNFVIRLHTLFDDVIMVDTVNAFQFTFKPVAFDSINHIVVTIKEVGKYDEYSLLLLKASSNLLELSDKPLEQLNEYLLNGYFLNAWPILERLNQPELLRAFSEQFSLLFPAYYPHPANFFNSYISADSSDLITMPYTFGLNEFMNGLNQGTRKESKVDDLSIELLVSTGNQVVSYKTRPQVHQDLLKELIAGLRFNNRNDENTRVLIKISKSTNGKRYDLINYRALMDPKSEGFRMAYPAPSATVH